MKLENRQQKEESVMNRTAYSSDITDDQWKVIEPLIPPAKPGGRPRSVGMREILNAIFYVVRSGCAWRLIPHDLPIWSTVYDYFRQSRKTGVGRTFMMRCMPNCAAVRDAKKVPAPPSLTANR